MAPIKYEINESDANDYRARIKKKTQINYTSTINETQDAHQMTLNK